MGEKEPLIDHFFVLKLFLLFCVSSNIGWKNDVKPILHSVMYKYCSNIFIGAWCRNVLDVMSPVNIFSSMPHANINTL